MNKIFVEAQKEETSECNFLHALFAKHFPTAEIDLIKMKGVDNLFNESIMNQIRIAAVDGDNVMVLLDADSPEKGWGFEKRQKDVVDKMNENSLSFPFFLYPNNRDNGDVEVLMESIARKDLHPDWWGCFEDYEMCVKGVHDEKGNTRYNIPDRKAKLHTYIRSQKLSCKERNTLGSGNWLFDDDRFWNIKGEALNPLLDFLRKHIQ